MTDENNTPASPHPPSEALLQKVLEKVDELIAVAPPAEGEAVEITYYNDGASIDYITQKADGTRTRILTIVK